MQEERRKFPRVTLDVDIRVKLSKTDEDSQHRIRDLSESGVYIVTEKTRPIGTGIDLTLIVGDAAVVVRTRGIIVHEITAADATAERPPGIGVMFLDISKDAKDALRKLVQSGKPAP